jgi:hypothetical protein
MMIPATRRAFRSAALGLLIALFAVVPAMAHETTVKGTVAAIEPARIQIKTGEEKQGQAPVWYPIDAKTKIMRGKATLSFGDAKISTGERVVVLLDHDAKGVMKTLEVRLAER